MVRSGFDPASPIWWSAEGRNYSALSEEIQKRPLNPPNLAGQIHFALQTFWESLEQGLGARCLLVSESQGTSTYLSDRYRNTEFLSCDLFTELHEQSRGRDFTKPDFVWDVNDPPVASVGKFDSVIANALLEHVIDPVRAMTNMAQYLSRGGRLYVMTHTPSFHVHRYPRDYLRFNRDFWEDLPSHMKKCFALSLTLESLYLNDGIVCVAYRVQ